jgi:hypothetical protein
MHEDAGMMGQFLVVPPGYVGIGDEMKLTERLIVYPNPIEAELNLKLPNEIKSFDLRIFDISGKVVWTEFNLTSR